MANIVNKVLVLKMTHKEQIKDISYVSVKEIFQDFDSIYGVVSTSGLAVPYTIELLEYIMPQMRSANIIFAPNIYQQQKQILEFCKKWISDSAFPKINFFTLPKEYSKTTFILFKEQHVSRIFLPNEGIIMEDDKSLETYFEKIVSHLSSRATLLTQSYFSDI